jgi:hypothetical protein
VLAASPRLAAGVRRLRRPLIRNPRLGHTYKAYFGDIYQLDRRLLPTFDVVALFHVGEFRTEKNDAYGALTISNDMTRRCSILVAVLYSGSFAHDTEPWPGACSGPLMADAYKACASSEAGELNWSPLPVREGSGAVRLDHLQSALAFGARPTIGVVVAGIAAASCDSRAGAAGAVVDALAQGRRVDHARWRCWVGISPAWSSP